MGWWGGRMGLGKAGGRCEYDQNIYETLKQFLFFNLIIL